jgi:small-conductance mechanosensitive channel
MSGAMATFDAWIDGLSSSRWVQSLAVLVMSLVVAFIADFVISRGIARLARRTRTDIDDRLIGVLHQPIRVSVVIVGLVLVTLRLDPSSLLEEGQLNLTALTLNLLATVAIVLWVVAGLRVAGLLLEAASGRASWLETRTLPLFRNLANVLLFAAAIYFVFVTWGIDVTAWLASAGIVGIAVGFAAKDSLANLFAGIFILTDAPYQVGDWVILGSGERGQVTHIGIRSTRMLTRDDVEVTVQVRELLERVGAENQDICHDPEPRVRFRGFGDSSLDLDLLAWIEDPVDRGRISDALYSTIYKRLNEAGIEIPYPKRDLYLKQMPKSLLPESDDPS